MPPLSPNGMRLTFHLSEGKPFRETWFSIGGGFVIKEGDRSSMNAHRCRI
ncbi:MAG: serine dehydratase beta chain [Calditrichia bacterium]